MTSGASGGPTSSSSGAGGGPPNQNITNRTSTTASTETSTDQQKETFRILKEMSDILNTGLDTQSLGLCLRLCEQGVNPVALANFIRDSRQQRGGD